MTLHARSMFAVALLPWPQQPNIWWARKSRMWAAPGGSAALCRDSEHIRLLVVQVPPQNKQSSGNPFHIAVLKCFAVWQHCLSLCFQAETSTVCTCVSWRGHFFVECFDGSWSDLTDHFRISVDACVCLHNVMLLPTPKILLWGSWVLFQSQIILQRLVQP